MYIHSILQNNFSIVEVKKNYEIYLNVRLNYSECNVHVFFLNDTFLTEEY